MEDPMGALAIILLIIAFSIIGLDLWEEDYDRQIKKQREQGGDK
jgi:hypothetical protein